MANFNLKIQRQTVLRALMSLIGVIIQSFGGAILLESNLGMDPYSAMNLGISKMIGWQLGTFQLALNFVVLIVVFFVQKNLIGVGTIFNMVLVGYGIQFFSELYQKVLPDPSTIVWQVVVAVIGLLIFTFGLSMYIVADVGVSPFDAITPMIMDITHSEKYRLIRIIQDTTTMLIALLVRGPFGLVTLIVAFGTGPFIIFWSDKVHSHLLKKISNR